jgi:hypothetical protein
MTRKTIGSLGASRVRESFNPSGNEMVDKIKRYTADLIDLCEEIKEAYSAYADHPPNSEAIRCAALAQTAYEEAAMWAVKATTTDKK